MTTEQDTKIEIYVRDGYRRGENDIQIVTTITNTLTGQSLEHQTNFGYLVHLFRCHLKNEEETCPPPNNGAWFPMCMLLDTYNDFIRGFDFDLITKPKLIKKYKLPPGSLDI